LLQGGGGGVISCGNVKKVWWVGQQLRSRQEYYQGRADKKGPKGTRGRYANLGFKLPASAKARINLDRQTLQSVPFKLNRVSYGESKMTISTGDETQTESKEVDFVILSTGIKADFGIFSFALTAAEQLNLVTSTETCKRFDTIARNGSSAFARVQGKQLTINGEDKDIYFVGK
jgi:hypothetical protein